MKPVVRNIIELDETSFIQLIRESRSLTCNWFKEILCSDHVLRINQEKASLSSEIAEVLSGNYYSAEQQLEFVSSRHESSSSLPALYRIVGDGGLFECYLGASKNPILSSVPLQKAMEEFLLMPKNQSYSYPADKSDWHSLELGPLNFDERIAIFDDYAMANGESFVRYVYDFLSELIRLRNLKTLKLFVFFSLPPDSEGNDDSDDVVINRFLAELKRLPIKIHIAWFQLRYDAKKTLSGTHQRFLCASSFEIVRDGGFNNKVNSKNLRVNRHFCDASQIAGSAKFLQSLNVELKTLQKRRRSSMLHDYGGDVKEVIRSPLPLVPFLTQAEEI